MPKPEGPPQPSNVDSDQNKKDRWRRPNWHTESRHALLRRPLPTHYADQPPRIESYDIGDAKNYRALTFHINGQRFYLKEGDGLKIIRNARDLFVTPQDIELLRQAVEESGDEELIAFLQENLK